MAFARAAYWRNESDDESALNRSFWRKTKRVAAQLPFAEDLLAAYYCAFDRATPSQVKAALLGAIAYFILPIDAIPDFLPVLGYTDDAAVLLAAINLVAGHITPGHRGAARETLEELAGR
jgi:uncharacterized membrane protein YkvA (DUF1232 family)